MSNIDIEVAAPLNPTKKVGRFTFSKEEVKERSTPSIWKTFNFWIETTIFVISVLGAICIAFGVMKGFLLWFVSNSICIGYFSFGKQYPLALQQLVFLITTILGIVHHSENIFNI